MTQGYRVIFCENMKLFLAMIVEQPLAFPGSANMMLCHMLLFTCHLSLSAVTCHISLSPVTCHLSYATYHLVPVMYQLSLCPVTLNYSCHLSHVLDQLSLLYVTCFCIQTPVTLGFCHLSYITCHMSPVTGHL